VHRYSLSRRCITQGAAAYQPKIRVVKRNIVARQTNRNQIGPGTRTPVTNSENIFNFLSVLNLQRNPRPQSGQ